MEYKGIEYRIVQAANPSGWVWTVYLPRGGEKIGRSRSRLLALSRVEAIIEEVAAQATTRKPIEGFSEIS